MKKLLLGLGAVSIAALPVLAVVSCSSETTTTTDLKITVKPKVDAALVTAADTAYKAAKDDTAKIEALTPIFAGISTTNFVNFEVTSTPEKITLKAKSGFSFAGKTTLEAPAAPVVKDFILTQTNADKAAFEAAATAFEAATTDEEKLAQVILIVTGIANVEEYKLLTIAFTKTELKITPIEGKSTIDGKKEVKNFAVPATK